MRVLSPRNSDPFPQTTRRLAQTARPAVIVPVLPALIRCVTFFSALATPFVAALLIR
jgi:hypothetical protein